MLILLCDYILCQSEDQESVLRKAFRIILNSFDIPLMGASDWTKSFRCGKMIRIRGDGSPENGYWNEA